MTINRQVDKQSIVYIYTEILFALKKEILIYTTTGMNPEHITVSEIKETQ